MVKKINVYFRNIRRIRQCVIKIKKHKSDITRLIRITIIDKRLNRNCGIASVIAYYCRNNRFYKLPCVIVIYFIICVIANKTPTFRHKQNI